MKKLGVLILATAFVACATPKPRVNGASNPYAARPDLLQERRVVNRLVGVNNQAAVGCAFVIKEAEQEKDQEKASLAKLLAYGVCVSKLSQVVQLIEKAEGDVHGEYLEAMKLLKRALHLHIKTCEAEVKCLDLADKEAVVCRQDARRLELQARAAYNLAGEFISKLLLGTESAPASQPVKKGSASLAREVIKKVRLTEEAAQEKCVKITKAAEKKGNAEKGVACEICSKEFDKLTVAAASAKPKVTGDYHQVVSWYAEGGALFAEAWKNHGSCMTHRDQESLDKCHDKSTAIWNKAFKIVDRAEDLYDKLMAQK